MSICRIVTRDAITTINEGMRTISGIRFLISEMIRLEKMRTAIVARPIDIPFMALLVVPSVGHMPSRSTNVGFSFMIPFSRTFMLFISVSSYSLNVIIICLFAGSALSVGRTFGERLVSCIDATKESSAGYG